SATRCADVVLAAVRRDESLANAIAPDLVATLLAADPQDGATRLLDTLSLEEGGTYSEWTFSAAASIARSLPVKKRPVVKEHPAMRAILESARTTLTDSSAPVNLRRSAIELLAGWLGSERDRE